MNGLLAALPNSVQERWLPQLESVQMPLGGVLYESGGTLSHVYFPATSIVSLLYVMENGASAEIAVVGNEGIVGISLFMGGESTPSRAVIQSGGHGFRLKSALVKDEFNQAGPVLHLLLRYTQALITQMAQTAVCNRYERVCAGRHRHAPTKAHVSVRRISAPSSLDSDIAAKFDVHLQPRNLEGHFCRK
jgi:hypothetical protein